jgi:serine/threonine-protein kinase PpkA
MEPGSLAQNFYIMPILDFDNYQDEVTFLQVATIDGGNKAPSVAAKEKIANKFGYVFVVDTSLGMEPYMEVVRDVTEELFDTIEALDNVKDQFFAFIAFRSNAAKPEIEYTTKVISDFKSIADRSSFTKALAQVKEAKVSGQSFNEDSFAGLSAAYNDLNWDGFSGGVVFLITDSPPIDSEDPLKTTSETPETILQRANDKNIKNVVIHLQTKEGASTHDVAKSIYESISFTFSDRNAYVDIPVKDISAGEGPQILKAGVKLLFERLLTHLNDVDNIVIPKFNEKVSNADSLNPKERSALIGDMIGFSFRIDDLLEENKLYVPKVVRAWIADKDLPLLLSETYRVAPVLEISALLTRDQLKSLAESVRSIIESAKDAKLDDESLSFFNRIQEVAATFCTDPNLYSFNPSAKDPGRLGVVSELIKALPYKSDIMQMTEQQWDSFDNASRKEYIDALSAKLKTYKEYISDDRAWFMYGVNSDEYIKVPLSLLP